MPRLLALLAALGASAATHLPRAVTTVTPAQLAELTPYTQFARAAYCSPSIVQGWACGRRSPVFRNSIRLTPPRGLPSCPRLPGLPHRW